MAGIERTQTGNTGFGVHDSRIKTANLNASDSTYTQAGNTSGRAEPSTSNTGTLAIATSGDQAADSDLDVQIIRGGFPGVSSLSAGYVHKAAADAATEYRGRELPNVITEQKLLQYETTTERIVRDSCTLPDGTVVVLYEHSSDASNYSPRTQRLPAGSDTWSTSVIVVHGAGSAGAGARYPCLIPISNDLLLCAVWVNDSTASVAQVRVYQSTDQGASWDLYADATLLESISLSTYTVGELNGAYGTNGEIVLFGELIATGSSAINNRIAQWASSDLGNTFTQVQISDGTDPGGAGYEGGIRPRVVWAGGVFHVAYISYESGTLNYSTANTQRLGSAFDSISFATPTSTNATWFTLHYIGDFDTSTKLYVAASGTEPSLAMCVGNDDTIYLTGRVDNTISGAANIEGQWFIARTQDLGRTWDQTRMGKSSATGTALAGAGATWWRSEDLDNTPEHVSITWREGRMIVACNWVTNTSSMDNSVSILYLGGHSTLTLPGYEPFPTDEKRIAWEHTWLPTDNPNIYGTWTLAVGTGTFTIGEDVTTGRLRGRIVTTAAGGDQHYWTATPAGTVEEGCTVEAHVRYTSGDAAPNGHVSFHVKIASGSKSYAVRCDMGTDGFRLYDMIAGSYIAATTSVAAIATTGIAIRLSVADGNVACWYRALETNPGHDRSWTAGPTSGSLSNGGASTASIHWGHPNAAATTDKTSDWFAFLDVSDEYNNGGLAEGQTNPDDLFPIPLPGKGLRAYVADGVYISGGSGLAVRGDAYGIATHYRYSIRNLDSGLSPSPAEQWRSTGDNAVEDIAWDLSDLSDPGALYGEVGFLYLGGINFDTFSLRGSNAGGTYSDILASQQRASIGLQSLAFTRDGTTIRPAAGASAGERYIHRNELAGFTVDLGSGVLRRVKGNSPGIWTGTSTAMAPRPRIELESVAGGDPSSGNCDIWATSVLCVWMGSSPPLEYRSIMLRIAAQHTVDDDYRIGVCLIGSVELFGTKPSNVQEIDLSVNRRMRASAGGRRSARKRGPAQLGYTLRWEPLYGASHSGETPDVDYVLATNSSGADPAAAFTDVLVKIQGLLDELQEDTCLLIRDFPSGSPDTNSFNKRGEIYCYGRLMNDRFQRRMTFGREAHTPLEASGELRFEEEV